MKSLFALGSLMTIFMSLAACGQNDEIPPTKVNIQLSEFKIESSVTSFEAGKTYEFVVENMGSMMHEFMVTPMDSGHNMGVMMEIEEDEMGPGMMQTKKFTFDGKGQFEFACHLPGHYEGGMKLTVTAS